MDQKDLIEQKQKTEESNSFEQRFDLAHAVSISGFWDWNMVTNQVYTSPRLKELLGYTVDEIEFTMEDFWTMLHPEDVPVVQKALDKHLEEKTEYDMEFRLASKSGEFLWFHSIGQAVWNKDNQAFRMAGSITNITQLKKTQEEFEQIKELYELVLAGSEAGIWDYDFITDKAYFSDRFKELMGYEPKELENMTAEESWSYLHPDFREKAPMALQYHLEGKTPYYSIDYKVRMKSGEYRWFQARGKAIWNDQGQPIRVAGSFVDIHDQKVAEEKIREQRDAIARMDRTRMLGQLTASIAHEINQPLAGILSNAQAAQLMINKNASANQDIQEILDAIVSDTKRASSVIRNIRELYREHKLETIPFKINEIVNQTLQLLNSEFVSNNIKTYTKLSPTLSQIEGNAVQIQQVLVNLLTNAIEALGDQNQVDRKIYISTIKANNNIEVWIKDNGPGIDPDKLDQITQPLATWKSGGMGMGLAISNSIIEAHGGRIMVHNISTGGCKAGFRLPMSNKQKKL